MRLIGESGGEILLQDVAKLGFLMISECVMELVAWEWMEMS